MQDSRKDFAETCNLLAREFKFSERSLEMLKSIGIIDARLELARVAEVSPPFLAGSDRISRVSIGWEGDIIQTEVLLLGRAGTSQKVVKDVKVALAGWDCGHATAFQPVIKELSSDQSGM